MAEPSPLRLWMSGKTSLGRVRDNNEDNLWLGSVGDPASGPGEREGISGSSAHPGVLLVVADGIGGEEGGEVASRMAVETVAREIASRAGAAGSSSRDLAEAGLAAVRAANERIRDESARDLARERMGTTLTAAWVVGTTAELFHVGDSRAYLLRRGVLKQLTRDQNYAAKLVEQGLLTEEEAERHPYRNHLLQSLGSEQEVEPEHASVPLEDGDKLLLCTDGLHGLVTQASLQNALRNEAPLFDQCHRLIEMAEHEGGTDNITVLLARIGR
jgi:serine/threonine protein phosphatase PrpC